MWLHSNMLEQLVVAADEARCQVLLYMLQERLQGVPTINLLLNTRDLTVKENGHHNLTSEREYY